MNYIIITKLSFKLVIKKVLFSSGHLQLSSKMVYTVGGLICLITSHSLQCDDDDVMIIQYTALQN